MSTKLKIAINWFKRNWKWVAGITGLIILFILAYTFIKDKKLLEVLQTKIKLYKAEKDIAYLEGKKEVISDNIYKVDEDIDLIDKRIEDIKKETKSNVDRIKELSPDEKLERFEKLGY